MPDNWCNLRKTKVLLKRIAIRRKTLLRQKAHGSLVCDRTSFSEAGLIEVVIERFGLYVQATIARNRQTRSALVSRFLATSIIVLVGYKVK
jgi:hypothetical protein